MLSHRSASLHRARRAWEKSRVSPGTSPVEHGSGNGFEPGQLQFATPVQMQEAQQAQAMLGQLQSPESQQWVAQAN